MAELLPAAPYSFAFHLFWSRVLLAQRKRHAGRQRGSCASLGFPKTPAFAVFVSVTSPLILPRGAVRVVVYPTGWPAPVENQALARRARLKSIGGFSFFNRSDPTNQQEFCVRRAVAWLCADQDCFPATTLSAAYQNTAAATAGPKSEQ